jgi:hypothetical protein
MFGISHSDEGPNEVRVGFRRGWFRYLNIALGVPVGAAVLLGAIRILESNPKDAFTLLQSWGPGYFIGALGVVMIGGLLSQIVDISRDGVQAQRQMAEAMTAIAQKDDRQLQEIQTLAAYTAQQSERMHRRHVRMEESLAAIATKLKVPHAALGKHDEQ